MSIMRNLKKALSLALTLALALALAVPAFAADSTFDLSVQGKPGGEVILPSSTYTLVDCDRTTDGDVVVLTRLGESRSYVPDRLIGLNQSDTMILTGSAGVVIIVGVQAWSDPDGDGVYEQQFLRKDDDGRNWVTLSTPVGSEPVRYDHYVDGNYSEIYDEWYIAADGQLGWGMEVEWHLEGMDSGKQFEVAVSANDWFQLFGSNTLLTIDAEGHDANDWNVAFSESWAVLLTNDSQPTAPAQPEQPAAPAEPEQPAASSGISVTVGGTAVEWTDAAPFIDANSRTMVPLRAVADAMSLTVNWDGDAREASFSDGSKTICFPIDSTSARTSDGGAVEMDTAAVIASERTYAPIRYLAEYFGYTVGWDGATQTVSLTK